MNQQTLLKSLCLPYYLYIIMELVVVFWCLKSVSEFIDLVDWTLGFVF
jgi:hypothetical protein